MAKSRFEYVRNFELPDPLIPETFIVVRIDGRGFHKFSNAHKFDKPNDIPALDLMNRAARAVMDDLSDVIMAFGESDEYSFLIRKQSNLYSRRRSKINSAICSIFTSAYVFYWNQYLPERPLVYPPSFDSRVVLYPSAKEVRDYFSWRQADTHINNLYNTCFWCLVKSGMSTNETNKALQGTDSKDKNELLFSRFGINYNKLPEMFRKGSILVREERTRPMASTSRAGSAPTISLALANGESAVGVDSGPSLSAEELACLRTEGERPQAGRAEERIENSNPSDPLSAAVSSQIPDQPQRTDHAIDDTGTNGPDTEGQSAPIRMRQRKEKKVRPYDGLTGNVVVLHLDIIGKAFWDERPWLLA